MQLLHFIFLFHLLPFCLFGTPQIYIHETHTNERMYAHCIHTLKFQIQEYALAGIPNQCVTTKPKLVNSNFLKTENCTDTQRTERRRASILLFSSISCISFAWLCFDLYLHLSFIYLFRFRLCVCSQNLLELVMCWSFVECALDPHFCFLFCLSINFLFSSSASVLLYAVPLCIAPSPKYGICTLKK